MTPNRSTHFDNPFPNQFPVIAGRFERFDRVVMKKPSIVKIVAELFARLRGEKPVPLDSLISFSLDDIQPLTAAALEFRTNILFEQLIWDMTGNPILNDELQGFVAAYFIHTETICDYATSLRVGSNLLSPSRTKVVNALRFFFSTENEKTIEHGRFTQYHLLSAKLKKLQQRYERRQVHSFSF